MILSRYGQTCMEFKRAMTAANNFDCPITPQTPVSINLLYFIYFTDPVLGINSRHRLTKIVGIVII